MAASVICVDLSSDSEDESPSGAKRRRLEDPLRLLTPSIRYSLPAKLVTIPKASLESSGGLETGTGSGSGPARSSPILADHLRSMHIPSGITVTKHQKNNMTANGNLTISLAENNNNNTNSFNNNVKAKVKMGSAQNIAWSVSSKAPSPNALITSVPSHQVRVTPSQQTRVTPTGKMIHPPTGVVPKTVPAKIIPPVGIGQQQQKTALKLSLAKSKPPMGLMLQLQQQQQQHKAAGQIQPQTVKAGQQQTRPMISQAQQQQQLKTVAGQIVQQQQKILAGVLGGQIQTQKIVLGPDLHQQQKSTVGQQQQQQKQQSQRVSTGQLQQQLKQSAGRNSPQQQQRAVKGQNQQDQKQSLGQLPQQQIQKQFLGQLPQGTLQKTLQPQLQKSLSGHQALQQHQKISMGQLQQQQQQSRASMDQLQMQELQQNTNQSQQQLPAMGQQQKALMGSQQLQQHIASIGSQQQQQQKAQALKQTLLSQQQQKAQAQLSQLQQKAQTQISQQLQKTQAQQSQQQQKTQAQHSQQQQKTQVQQSQQQQKTQSQLSQQQQKTQAQLSQQQPKTVMRQQNPGQQPPPLVPKPMLPTVNQITHKSMTIQRLPTVPKAPTVARVPPKQLLPQQAPPAAHLLQKQAPPPAHMLQKQTPPSVPIATPPPAHKISPTILQPKSAAKISPIMPPMSRASLQMKAQVNNTVPVMSAARTMPFRSLSHMPATPALTSAHLQGFTTSATPPQRLLATPPHCAAALNEPLLLNLPPTTSITPQLTPTTTPPPSAIPAAVQQQQLAKAAFQLNSLPGASISPVPVLKPPTKRIQPITVLKKSDEEWRKHILAQQQQQQKQQNQPETVPTIVLVESPPTTPPTDKAESENKTNSAGKQQKILSNGVDKQLSKLKKSSFTPPVTEVVDLDELPETPPDKEKVLEKRKEESAPTRQPFISEYAALLKLCREVDKTSDMERLAQGKLTKYYYSVHESFVKSRGFRKLLEVAMLRIRSESDMVYVHLKSVVDELKARRKAKVTEKRPTRVSPAPGSSTPAKRKPKEQEEHPPKQDERAQEKEIQEPDDEPEPVSPTGDKRQDERIRKLNRTLYTITKRIKMLEEADVDFNDDDSSFLQVERFKKRACQIYEKICDLTGESKSALRQLKQPILFKDTQYPQFNRTLSAFVNRMQQFPDYHDVLQLLEHCNKEKELGLANFEMKRIAYDAFVKVGRLLQSRRKTDLYETVTHFTANVKDPAATDPELLAKLKDNNKKQTKISDVLEKFAREQDLNAEERQETRLKEKQLKQKQAEEAERLAALVDDDDQPCTSAQAAAKAAAAAALRKESDTLQNKVLDGEPSARANPTKEDDGGEDSEEESETEDEEEDVDDFVDNFKANGEISDAESEAEIVDAVAETAPKTDDDVIDITRAETAAEDDEALPNSKLKIMSVSSLNATVLPERNPKSKSCAKPAITAEIVISDEES
ncbi:hypothetical protein KR009_004746 [Drosophila setifemur]|nr:hypothetical protein KR009_004746 [Drosophila setifemur]